MSKMVSRDFAMHFGPNRVKRIELSPDWMSFVGQTREYPQAQSAHSLPSFLYPIPHA